MWQNTVDSHRVRSVIDKFQDEMSETIFIKGGRVVNADL